MDKRKEVEPQEVDWLFSCPATMSSQQIAAALGMTSLPMFDLSASSWQESWHMGNDVLKAQGFAKEYFYQPGRQVSWDSLNDWIGGIGNSFKGELWIIRESRVEALASIALLVDITSSRVKSVKQRQHLFPHARINLVLPGWIDSTFLARVPSPGYRIAFKVNFLPETT
ncbi:MAG TPA: hypothetical protein VNE61_15645 [Ktedonobacteraceae bacterium]|nr:hypothetical protein [Ktedonobacteraceae bacterium]